MACSLDFHKKLFEIQEKKGLAYASISERFDVGISSVFRWKHNLEPMTVRKRSNRKIDMEALYTDVINAPDDYQWESAQRFGVSQPGIGKALKRLGISYKKNFETPKSR